MNTSRVSLITAYYKNELMTQDFLNNLKDKIPNDTEVILVNAGSKPIYNPLFTYRVDLFENHSFSNSFNAGIKRSSGDWVCIINNDAFPETEGWLEELIEIAEKSKAWITAPVNDKTDLANYRVLNLYKDYRQVVFFPAVCWLMPRECIEAVGEFDEQFIGGNFEDNDYCERVAKLGHTIVVTDKVKIKHLESQTLQLLENKNLMMENYQRFVAKYK